MYQHTKAALPLSNKTRSTRCSLIASSLRVSWAPGGAWALAPRLTVFHTDPPIPIAAIALPCDQAKLQLGTERSERRKNGTGWLDDSWTWLHFFKGWWSWKVITSIQFWHVFDMAWPGFNWFHLTSGCWMTISCAHRMASSEDGGTGRLTDDWPWKINPHQISQGLWHWLSDKWRDVFHSLSQFSQVSQVSRIHGFHGCLCCRPSSMCRRHLA